MDSTRGQDRRSQNTPSSHGRNLNHQAPDRRNRYKDAVGDNANPLINSTSSLRSVQDTAAETSSSPSNSGRPKANYKFRALRRKNRLKTTRNLDANPAGPLSELKNIMTTFSQGVSRSIEYLEKFLRLSLNALNCNDKEIYSQAALLLIENPGIKIIRRIMEAVGNPQGDHPLSNLNFDRHMVPFIKIIVHDKFIQNPVLQEIFGDAVCSCKFLKRATEMLQGKAREAATDASKTLLQDVNYCLCRILQYLMRYNPEAARRKAITEIHSALVELSNTLRIEGSSISIDSILSGIRAFLLPKQLRQEYWPGVLSKYGPRHDNDFHIIDQICFLPTKEELNSKRSPYLPINASDAPHFLDGPNRLFDIHFRLLREDMLGQLRPPIVALLKELKRSSQISQSLSNPLRDPAIRLYDAVTVRHANFDKFRGVEFCLRFRQPERLRSLQRRERIHQWGQIKSLDGGAFLYLVSKSSLVECFLIVTEKNEKALGDDKEWSRINVQLADPDAKEVLLHLLQNMGTERPGNSFVLVEFTGILLPAYQLFLDDLQKRSRNSFLPFSNLLCSQFNPNTSSIVIPPPAYTRSNRFHHYDLAPLGKPFASLRLHLKTSPNDEGILRMLEKNTDLDAGQCKGLVAALTRELALVQG
jgi:hypothetical protein